MKDRVLLSVTQVLDDSTGIWANDLCEYSIHSADLDDFLKTHGENGAKEICKMFDLLKKEVYERVKSIKSESSNKTCRIKLSRTEWNRLCSSKKQYLTPEERR